MRHLAAALALIVLVRVPGAPGVPPDVDEKVEQKNVARKITLTDDSRLAFIRRAQVWTKTDISNMNLRAGPRGHGAFEPNQMVTCDYVETRMHGTMPKFHCAIGKDDVIKVRYGAHIGEVE